MVRLIITFLIVFFGMSFFFFKKNEELENKLDRQIDLNELLMEKLKESDSIFKKIESDSIIRQELSKEKVLSRDLMISKHSTATWYEMHGSKTYSGEIFHRDSLVAAYYTKMGSYLRVTNIENGKSVIVKVIDRMGSRSKNRIDLSKKAFNEIGSSSSGRMKVIIEKI
jgi:rare lipoprotein A